MRKVSARRRESQGGYALLMIFLMAAIIALMLYQQLPRVAFESEREKEQLLIDRGEQYTRAIQLYYLANNRTYPTSIDDLEKQEKRFLRRRFVDPFTGKADWRIVHTNGGFLTDSLVQKPPTDSQGQSAGNTTNSNTSSASNTNSTNNTTAANDPPKVNAAVLQRPSDRPVTPPGFGQTSFGQPTFTQDPSATQPVNTPLPPITLQPQQGPGQGQGALPPITLQPGSINQPGGLPPITLAPVGQAGGQQNPGQVPGQFAPQLPGQVPGQVRNNQGAFPPVIAQPNQGQPNQGQPNQGQLIQGQPGIGQPIPGGLPGAIPGVPPGFQIDVNGQLVPTTPPPGQGGIPGLGVGTSGQSQVPGQPFTPQPPTAAGPIQGSPSAALTAINQLLTTPRQVNNAPSTPAFTNQVGAIAGIASTHTGPSIKVYKDQQKYELWEFVFSPTASTITGGGAGGLGAAPGVAPGAPGQPSSTFAPSGTFVTNGGQGAFGAGPGR